jgi:sugar phosphate isomerase/epimerase
MLPRRWPAVRARDLEVVLVLAPAIALVASSSGCDDAAAPPPPLVCATATGVAIDLVPYARLDASATRPSGPPWPRESEDAIATIRDDDEATYWKAPDDGATITIDLQPWLGRPVALAELALSGSVGLESATVRVLEACGARALRTFIWSDPGAPLDLGGTCGACVEIDVPAGSDGIHALALTSRDGSITPPALGAAQVVPPAERLAHVGVIEGFYGVPWSFRERRHMVATIRRLGFDTYIYGPKNDPLHRDRWREPYPEAWRAQFAALAAFAEEVNVELIYAITPFIDFRIDDPADYAALLAKLKDIAGLGVAGVALFADDIELAGPLSVNAALGAAHAQVVARLGADLATEFPELTLGFVPTVYSDARAADFADGPGYLMALRDLGAHVPIFWTGPDTFAATLRPSDLAMVSTWIGRPPFIWDNFWANDGGDGFFGRLVLAPLSGRSAEVVAATAGIAFNMSIQGSLSRLSLATAAAQLRADADLDPGLARAPAAMLEASLGFGAAADPQADAELAGLVMEVFDAKSNDVPRHARLDAAIDALDLALGQGGVPVAAMGPVVVALAELAVLPSRLHHSGLDADLVDDLAFPVARTTAAADLGLAVVVLLGERLAGRSGDQENADAMAKSEAAAPLRFRFDDRRLRALWADVAARPVEDRGFVAVAAGEAPPVCLVGKTLEWRPLDAGGGDEVHIHGLPGATVSGGVVRFTAPHAGRYDAIAVALRDGSAPGWGVTRFSMLCGIERAK